MATLIRLGIITFLCAALAACAAALLPAVVVPQVAATVGVAGLTATSCAGNSSCEPEARQCTSPTDKRIEVVEARDVDIARNEGEVAGFTPAYWQPQFASGGVARTATVVAATAGTFAVSDKSIVFAPPRGTEGVRIPLASVLNVELQRSSTTGAPHQVTVESCFGRLDRFTFGQSRQPDRLDSKATADAAAEIRARMAKARTVGHD